ncbi:MAG: MFS transporter [Candidatus Omnitrophota bacterium]
MKKLTFIILCLEGAILSFNVAAAAALIPSIARDFGVPAVTLGSIVWLYMIPYGLAALAYGPLVRVFDAKRVELVCFFFFSVANLMAAFSRTLVSLSVARFLMGAFGASVIPLVLILIARHTESAWRGKLVGTFFSATFVASLVGLLLSGVLHWRLIFLIPAIAGFLLLVCMAVFLPRFAPEASHQKSNYKATLADTRVLKFFTYIFLISFLYHGVQQWLGVYFSVRYGLSQMLVSALVTLTSLSGIFGEVIGGWFSDSVGRILTANVGIVLMVASCALLVFKMPFVALSVLMIVWGLGWTLNHAGISTILTDLPREFLNEAASLNSGVRFLSGGLGMFLGGIVMQKSFILGFSVAAVLLAALLLFSKRLTKAIA